MQLVVDVCFCESYGEHRSLQVRTHCLRTRRSSDLSAGRRCCDCGCKSTRDERRRSTACSYPAFHTPPQRRGGIRAIQRDYRHARPSEPPVRPLDQGYRSEEHTSELQSLMRISYAVFCLTKT